MCLTDTTTPYLVFCFMLMAIGFGLAFYVSAMTNACIESASRERLSIASAVLNAGRQVGSVLDVALLGTLVSQQPGLRARDARCSGHRRYCIFGRMHAVVLRDPRDQRVCLCDSRKLTERNPGIDTPLRGTSRGGTGSYKM
jgi:hypothetical protein